MAVDRLTKVDPPILVLVAVARGQLAVMLHLALLETAGLALPIASLAHLLITQGAAAVVRLAAVQQLGLSALAAAVTAALLAPRRRAVTGLPTRAAVAARQQAPLLAVAAGLALLLLEQQPRLHQQQAPRP
jgi:hypothetical protein